MSQRYQQRCSMQMNMLLLGREPAVQPTTEDEVEQAEAATMEQDSVLPAKRRALEALEQQPAVPSAPLRNKSESVLLVECCDRWPSLVRPHRQGLRLLPHESISYVPLACSTTLRNRLLHIKYDFAEAHVQVHRSASSLVREFVDFDLAALPLKDYSCALQFPTLDATIRLHHRLQLRLKEILYRLSVVGHILHEFALDDLIPLRWHYNGDMHRVAT
mmetsp:Transcript_49514/g.123115  ORF Transcript_49514/g.123115 Transcript_49514/m.123115 type:complete len:217 (-) Transcript_49514:55-705(-)